jgi:hypothetical protein
MQPKRFQLPGRRVAAYDELLGTTGLDGRATKAIWD